MKSFVAAALLAAIGALASTHASAAGQIHVRVHVHSEHSKLYITPMGEQCAYNASIDPAEYPCRDGGVCVRTNATYGECRLPKALSASGSRDRADAGVADDSDDAGDDDDDDDSSQSDDDDDSDNDEDSGEY